MPCFDIFIPRKRILISLLEYELLILFLRGPDLQCIRPQHFYKSLMFCYTVKNVKDIPVPSRDVTNQTLPGRE
jgi:hypothetical protein